MNGFGCVYNFKFKFQIVDLLFVSYAVDSQLILLQGIIASQAVREFHPTLTKGLTIAVYVGLFAGALFWGLSADIIGRRPAFNTSLIITGVFAIGAWGHTGLKAAHFAGAATARPAREQGVTTHFTCADAAHVVAGCAVRAAGHAAAACRTSVP